MEDAAAIAAARLAKHFGTRLTPEELAAQVMEALEQSGFLLRQWRRIDSAPKDGTEVLLYRQTIDDWGMFQGIYKIGYYDLRDGWGWWSHWTPLSPPTT